MESGKLRAVHSQLSTFHSPSESGAQGETRTRTDCSTRPSNVRGYQLRHLSLGNPNRAAVSSPISKNYFVGFLAGIVALTDVLVLLAFAA